MVTDTAPPGSRRYWQLPTFVLGVCAMAGAYRTFPPPAAAVGATAQTAARSVSNALSQSPPAWESVRDQIATLEATVDGTTTPDSATALLVGSWHLCAAETGPRGKDLTHWQRAAHHFNQVDATTLPLADVARFVYRRAKVDARLGSGKPAELLAALAAAPAGEDTGERGRAVYDAAMRMSPPDRLRARAGLEEYLTGPGVGRALPTDLAVYKLELGKLFLTDGKTAEAKTWLEPAAGPAGPADVRASALIQLGQLATAQKNVGEAEARFKEALAVGGLPNETRGHVRLLCGEGLVRIDKLADAAVAFAQAAREKGPVGLAAACRLAACNARGPALPGGRTSDVDALERCVAALSPDGKWDNPHVGIDHVRTTFEDVIRACVTDGDVKSATRAATLYDRVAAPGRGTELKAETFLGMAYTAAKKPDPTNAAATLAKAAAAEYDALAAAATAPAAKADALRKAAAALTVAGDKATAKERFEQILATPGLSPEAANAVRMDLADATTDPAKAAAVFQQVVEAGGTQAYGARVKLAVAQLDRAKQAMKDYGAEGKARADGWTAAAVTLLEQATTASAVAPTDQAAHEQALFTLGRVKMEHGQYADAAGRLRTLRRTLPGRERG